MSMTMGQNLFRSVQEHSRTMGSRSKVLQTDDFGYTKAVGSLPLSLTLRHSSVHSTRTPRPREPPSRSSSSQDLLAPQVPSTSPKMRATIILATLGALLLISSSSATPLVIKLEFSGVFKNYCGQRGKPCDGISATATSPLGDALK
ncbi:hypothetical protein K457DRAFT_17132 [Linnemannia elongata AG-77]|uniref:Uncharacterized protein n=1 Tax=Linnemannia elongata AG-77 TaxID=1314771 RepID=A0A197K3Q7_9FUNG|nr:hypothetical protein K457DRAFT_17132 [Linnemannia elongata AG-77]